MLFRSSELKSYRITLYENLHKINIKQSYRCSVEVIHESRTEPCAQEVLNELKTMNIFSQDSELTFLGSNVLPAGFPIPLVGGENQMQKVFSSVSMDNPAVTFIGRAKPELFFMSDVLIDSFTQTKELIIGKGL